MGFVVEPRQCVPGWGFGAGVDDFGLISAVATDSQGRVYVLSRFPLGVMHQFDPAGSWHGDWAFPFVAPHGLWIGPDDRVFVTDTEEHTVRIFDLEGNVLQVIGTPGRAGEPGEPFNRPTRAVQSRAGDIYVSDGYGQNRMHRFDADGRLIVSWGGDGTELGQFETPHGLWVDDEERVYVVDRGNGRVQVFDNVGTVLAVWDGFCFPHDIYQLAGGTFVVTDCAPRDDGSRAYVEQLPARPLIELSADGERIGATGISGLAEGAFPDCPHSLWVSPAGEVYVSEVVSHNRLQKFRAG